VGVVPLEAILMAADYYIETENLFILDEDQKVRLAIDRLGLNAVANFDPRERIIDYAVAEPPDAPLADMSVREFIQTVAARSSAPGGGSVSAAMAALGAGLGAMMAKLTFGVRKFEDLDSRMRAIIPPLHETARALIPMIDADTSAFNEYMVGLKMPKQTEAQRAARRDKMQAGLKTATAVPLETMRLADRAWDALCDAARYGNITCKSDAQVGARALEAGIWGAYQNVLINAAGLADVDFKAGILAEAEALAARATETCAQVLAILDGR
jgi:glutamate formiminotransferase/formiminotetrahydrofolate cyclodeaminase